MQLANLTHRKLYGSRHHHHHHHDEDKKLLEEETDSTNANGSDENEMPKPKVRDRYLFGLGE